MAARINKKHDDATRAKIRTSQLVNRLTNHALGGVDPKTKKPIELTVTQVKAIEILLRKALPDLKSITGDINHTLTHEQALAELDELD